MKLPRRKKSLRPLIPLASMGDIAFLLIIFFMLTSNFIKESPIKYTLPVSADIDFQKPGLVSVVMDEKGQLYLQGEPCHMEMLESRVREELEGKKDRFVMLKIDRAIRQRSFGPVYMALSRAGAQIAPVGRKEK